MPEGDSVFLLADRLRSALDGRLVESGELRGGASAGTGLDGWRVVDHETHGKHLLTRFEGGRTLHTHMRMQGSWTVTAPGKRLPRNLQEDVRVRLQVEGGRTAWGVALPVVELVETRHAGELLAYLGPDPLRADWDPAEAIRRLGADPDRALVAALLDQRCLAGLGNLWVNELCFLQGCYPWRRVGDVDLPRIVARAARALRASVTIPGMYQVTTGNRRRGEQHWVAGRAGRPCLRCGTTVEVRAEVEGDPEQRRTWWCPACQPEVRAG